MLFHAIRSGCAANVRDGAKLPAGLDCAGSEPREKSAKAPRSIDKSWGNVMWSVIHSDDDRTSSRVTSGVLNSTTKAAAPLTVTKFMSKGVVTRSVGDEPSHPAPTAI